VPDERFAELAAGRVVLRRLRPGDLAALVRYRSEPAVARFQGWDSPYPAADGERLIGEMLGRHPDTPGEWFQFAIAIEPDGRLAGDCGALISADDPRQAEIGFTLAPEHQGAGYATEAVLALLGYLFGERAKHRVTASCDPRNTRSAALLERVGMRREGHLVESTWAKGEWTDDLLYALLDREWAAGQARR